MRVTPLALAVDGVGRLAGGEDAAGIRGAAGGAGRAGKGATTVGRGGGGGNAPP